MHDALPTRLIACAAGLSIGLIATAQSDPNMQPPRTGTASDHRPVNPRSTPDDQALVRSYQFLSCDRLEGTRVVGPDDKKIGDVANVVFDRLSGHIESLAVDLGLLSRTVAVPFSQFSWAGAQGDDRKLALSMTHEQLKALPAFDKSAMERHEPSYRRDESATADPFQSSHRSAASVRGTVDRIDVMEMPDGTDYTVVTLSEAGSGPRRIALGPSWYTRGAAYVPFRGTQVTVKGYEVQRNGQPMLVATELSDAGGHTAIYRDDSGNPHWTRTSPTIANRYMLLSSLKGRDVQAQGKSCGEISDVIIERSSGSIAFLSIDPDENFLGIADTKRLVPFSLAVVPIEGPAQIDASKEMVTASIETPEDLSTLGASDRLTAAYRAFGVEIPRYRSGFREPSSRTMGDDPYNTSSWQRIGSTISQTNASNRVRVSGTVDSIETRQLGDGLGSVRVASLTADGKHYEVIVAPPSFLAKQKAIIAQGDQADFTLVPMKIDSRDYWVASTVQTKNGTLALWDDNGRPSWMSNR